MSRISQFPSSNCAGPRIIIIQIPSLHQPTRLKLIPARYGMRVNFECYMCTLHAVLKILRVEWGGCAPLFGVPLLMGNSNSDPAHGLKSDFKVTI